VGRFSLTTLAASKAIVGHMQLWFPGCTVHVGS
jgi:hypothetical protein